MSHPSSHLSMRDHEAKLRTLLEEAIENPLVFSVLVREAQADISSDSPEPLQSGACTLNSSEPLSAAEDHMAQIPGRFKAGVSPGGNL